MRHKRQGNFDITTGAAGHSKATYVNLWGRLIDTMLADMGAIISGLPIMVQPALIISALAVVGGATCVQAAN